MAKIFYSFFFSIDTKKRENNFLESTQSIVNTMLNIILGTLIYWSEHFTKVKKHFNINEVYNIDTKKRENNFLKQLKVL